MLTPTGVQDLPQHELHVEPVVLPVQVLGLHGVVGQVVELSPVLGTGPVWGLSLKSIVQQVDVLRVSVLRRPAGSVSQILHTIKTSNQTAQDSA